MIHQRETNPCADRIVPPYHHLQLDSPINFHHTSPKHSPAIYRLWSVWLTNCGAYCLPPVVHNMRECQRKAQGKLHTARCVWVRIQLVAADTDTATWTQRMICIQYYMFRGTGHGSNSIWVQYHKYSKYSMVNSEYGQSCPVHIAWHCGWVSIRMEVIRSGLAR